MHGRALLGLANFKLHTPNRLTGRTVTHRGSQSRQTGVLAPSDAPISFEECRPESRAVVRRSRSPNWLLGLRPSN
jgi:hypothetical protein